jgi:hypothetical protein
MSQEQSTQVTNYQFQSVQDVLIARGSTAATAFKLGDVNFGAVLNRFTTVAVGTGCMLPPAVQGNTIVVINSGANPLQVYANPGDTINTIAGVTGTAQMAPSCVAYLCVSTGQWFSQDLATGFYTFGNAALQVYSSQSGITAHAGGGQGAATPIVASQAQVSVCANAGDSVLMPPSQAGAELTIVNNGAQSCNVFPFTGEQINTAGANTAFALTANTLIIFFCFVTGNWVTK